MLNYLKIILLFLILGIGSVVTVSAQVLYPETYSVVGLYVEVSESEAMDTYHYIEYDDHYYIKEKFKEDEEHFITITEVLSPKLYRILWKENGKPYSYYMYLRYPAFLWKNEQFNLNISEIVGSEIEKAIEFDFNM